MPHTGNVTSPAEQRPGIPAPPGTEAARLADPQWRRWGTYLSERAWGTVREDYSADGDAWNYFPFEHAASRAYRWNEDGLAGWCDDQQLLCFGLALWNGKDERLKERPFGLTNAQGNHGEDVKDYWFFTDNLPSHAFAEMVYKYPLVAFPYQDLIDVNGRRGQDEPEYELFDALESDWRADRYVDIRVRYAKITPDEVACRITATNRSSENAVVHLAPQAWFRNTWTWNPGSRKPRMTLESDDAVLIEHESLDPCYWYTSDRSDVVFCENETDNVALFGGVNESPYTKNGVEEYLLHSHEHAINRSEGTKVAAITRLSLAPGEEQEITWVLRSSRTDHPFDGIDELFLQRKSEADEFYSGLNPVMQGAEVARVQRQALAGLLWCKQFYHYDVHRWLSGDPGQPVPPTERLEGRNHSWRHIVNRDVILMPDAWEYPWYAAWDWGFHNATMALIDPEFARQQARLLTSVRYQHPHGQVPAYEWDFSDTNPPVQSWSTWMIHVIDATLHGNRDSDFLHEMFASHLQQLMFWFNTKDPEGAGIFGGGFLGLDNIGVFDRDQKLPTGGRLVQVDGTAWMAATTLHLLEISGYLSAEDPAMLKMMQRLLLSYGILAHSLEEGTADVSLWSDDLGFYRDAIVHETGAPIPLDIVSVEGLVPLFASIAVNENNVEQAAELKANVLDFIREYPWLSDVFQRSGGDGTHRFFGVVGVERLVQILRRALDPHQLLSDFGIRSMSAEYETDPYTFWVGGEGFTVSYWPAESHSRMFGGNSNWRGPVWLPMNLLFIQSMFAFDRFYGETLTVEHPVGSGTMRTLSQVAIDVAERVVGLFLPDDSGRRPVFGDNDYMATNEHWRDLLPFYEYFDGTSGRGAGASHQTGWTATIALLIQCHGEPRSLLT
jgi:hypothetical protein